MHCRCAGVQLVQIFFFKQKTAYEMRISDWSSDVCSSDLAPWNFPPSQTNTGAIGRRPFTLRLGSLMHAEILRQHSQNDLYLELRKNTKYDTKIAPYHYMQWNQLKALLTFPGGYMSNNLFVERHDDGTYAVLKPGTQRASAVESTQQATIDRARQLNPTAT